MDDMVISFSKGGKVQAMHNDAFNLSFLGKRKIQRASDIKFNDDTNRWDICMNNGEGEFIITCEALEGFRDYEQARHFEVQWLNECRLMGAEGTSQNGLEVIAPRLRKALNL